MGEDNGKTVMTKEDYMRLALDIARKGRGRTSPNPMVGCVVVRNQRIVAEGYHERYGGFHAERNALTRCTEDLTGAEMYVTLEPCQMCSGAIVQSRIDKVVIGCMNPKAGCAGSILNLLQMEEFNHQVEMEVGVLEEVCSQMLKEFFKALREKKKEEKKKEKDAGTVDI